MANRKELTRERIIQAALKVFAEKGYFGTTVDEVVEESGTSKGAIYFHFESKEAIFSGLIEEMRRLLWEAVATALSREGGAVEKLHAAIRAGLQVFEENRELARITLLESVTLGPAIDKKQREVKEVFVGAIRGYLEELQAEGRLRPLDVKVASWAFYGTIESVVTHWLQTGDPEPLVSAAEELIRYNSHAIGLH